MKTQLLFAGLCGCVLFVFAAFSQAPPAETDLTGSAVYKKHCAKCHGKTAEGRHFGGPSLVSEKVARASAEDLRNMIANGKGRMPKFAGKLSTEEIDTLAQQIQALKQAK